MKSIMVVAALAALTSAPAYAKPPVDPRGGGDPSHDPYVRNFRRIAGARDFWKNYETWRREFPLYNWRTDGCTEPKPLELLARLEFLPACVQHDFGYNNNRLAHQHNETTRSFVDNAFWSHMKRICARHDSIIAKKSCYADANIYYFAVRAKGRDAF